MRLCAISDLHGTLPEIKESYDVVIIAGDTFPTFSNNNHLDAAGQADWLEKQLNPWLDDIKANTKILIAGNHDTFLGMYGKQMRNHLHCEYLEDESLCVKGYNIYGTPWTFRPQWANFPWAFGLRDNMKLKYAWEQIPKKTDVLVCHSPPYGIFDYCPPNAHEKDWRHIGCKHLLRYIDSLKKLQICCFGHCHAQDPFQMERNGVNFLNCAQRIISIDI